MLEGKLLIGGKWISCESKFESLNPATGEVLGKVCLASWKSKEQGNRSAPFWLGCAPRRVAFSAERYWHDRGGKWPAFWFFWKGWIGQENRELPISFTEHLDDWRGIHITVQSGSRIPSGRDPWRKDNLWYGVFKRDNPTGKKWA